MENTTTHNGIRRLSFEELKERNYSFAIGLIPDDLEGHLKHLIANKSISIKCILENEDSYSDKLASLAVVSDINDLKQYVALLHKYPEYFMAERENSEGAFSDIFACGDFGIRNYIRESKKRLEQGAIN